MVVDRNGKLIADNGLTGFYHADISHFHTNAGIRQEFILNWSVPGPVLMIRRGVLHVVGGYDEQRILEDWDFYLRMAAADLIGFTDVRVSAYRVHGDNFCMKPERLLEQLVDAQQILIKNLRLFGTKDKVSMIMKLISFTDVMVSTYRVHGSIFCKQPERLIEQLINAQKILLNNLPLFGTKEKVAKIKKIVKISKTILKLKIRMMHGQ
jgi:hypothetical protein